MFHHPEHMEESISIKGIFIWLLALLFFFYEFFLRIFLGTVASDIIHQLHLTAREFSFIAAAYYLTYGLMQIPVGFLIDKFGARLCLFVSSFVCALGVFCLSLAHGFFLAFVGRLLIGFGSSFAFVSFMLLILRWFPRRHFSLVSGLSIFLGSIGPLLAGAPLAYLYKMLDGDWRGILVGCGIFGVALSAALGLFVRNGPQKKEEAIIFLFRKEGIWKYLLLLFRNTQVWLILLYSGTTYVVLPIFAAYWGTIFLQARGISLVQAAFIISMVWIGYAIGSPLLGKLSDHFKLRKPFLYLPALLGAIVSALILYAPFQSEWILVILFIFVGIGGAGQTLSFTFILEQVQQKLHSSALGINSAGSTLAAALFPILVGTIIQWGKTGGAGAHFSEAVLVRGLSLAPLLFLTAFFISLFAFRETFCRQQYEVHKLHKYSDFLD